MPSTPRRGARAAGEGREAGDARGFCRGPVAQASLPVVAWVGLGLWMSIVGMFTMNILSMATGEEQEDVYYNFSGPIIVGLCLRGLAGSFHELLAYPKDKGFGPQLFLASVYALSTGLLGTGSWTLRDAHWVGALVMGVLVVPLLIVASRRYTGSAAPAFAAYFGFVALSYPYIGLQNMNAAAPLLALHGIHLLARELQERQDKASAASVAEAMKALDSAGSGPDFHPVKPPSMSEMVRNLDQAKNMPRLRASKNPYLRYVQPAGLLVFFLVFVTPAAPVFSATGLIKSRSDHVDWTVQNMMKEATAEKVDQQEFEVKLAKFYAAQLRSMLRDSKIQTLCSLSNAYTVNALYEDFHIHLGLPRTASPAQVKKAFRELSLTAHPDKMPGDKRAAERFRKIQRANDYLTKPESIKEYEDNLIFGQAAAVVRFILTVALSLPLGLVCCLFIISDCTAAPLYGSLASKAGSGRSPATLPGTPKDFGEPSTLSGDVLARSTETRMARADLQWWSQQLALALAVSASGIASKEHVLMKSKAKDKIEASLKLLGPMGRNLSAKEKERASAAIEAYLKEQGVEGGENSAPSSPVYRLLGRKLSPNQERRNAALEALWEVREEAGSRYEALRMAYNAALLSQLRRLDGYSGEAWAAAEAAATAAGTVSADAKTLVQAHAEKTVATVDPQEREAFLLACLRIAESASRGEFSLPGDKKNS